jgi:hypothetical protein
VTDALVCYYREGCHLCGELAQLLLRRWPEHARRVEWRDVDRSPQWRETYGHRVPVLLAADVLICELAPDPMRLDAYFGQPASTV